MANTQKYINHLLQNTGMTPACSEEERLASEDIAQIFRNHGFDPEIQEFNAPAPARTGTAVVGILAFAGALLMGIGGAIGAVGTILAFVAGVLFVLERTGRPVLAHLGRTGVSQNVIAYHKAEGPLASPRNRPVVVVAHYDSPRAEFLARPQYAAYRPLIARLLPISVLAPAVVAVLRVLPLPGALKVVLWICAVLLSLVALLNAVNIITNRLVLPYTSGAVGNKSSVAAMLGVMDAVAPYKGENEFPQDLPFDEYFGAQKRRAAEMAQAAAAYAQQSAANDYGNTIQYDEPTYTEDPFGEGLDEDMTAYGEETVEEPSVENEDVAPAPDVAPAEDPSAPADDYTAVDAEPEVQAEAAPVEPAPAPEPKLYRNESGNIRFGSEAIRALGMLSADCVLEYEDGQEPVFPEPEPVAAEPAPAASAAEQVVPAAAAPQQAVAPQPVAAPTPSTYAPAAPVVSDDTDDADEEFPPRVSYESDTDFSPQAPTSDTRSEISSAVSAFTSSASSFFKGAFAKGKRMIDDFEAKREAAHEQAEAEAIARQQAEEAAREAEVAAAEAAAAEEAERIAAQAEQAPVSEPADEGVAVDEAVSSEADEPAAYADVAPVPQPAPAEVPAPEATTTFEQLPVDGTVSFDATTSFDATEIEDGTAVMDADVPVDGTISYDATTAFEVPAEEPAAPEAPAEVAGDSAEAAPVQVDGTVAFPAVEAEPAPADTPVEEAASADKPYSTQIFTMPAPDDLDSTVARPATEQQPTETVDSLMAQISARLPHREGVSRRVPDISSTAVAPASQSPLRGVPDPSLPSMQQANPASRASLFDLPDPSAAGDDPFATQQSPALDSTGREPVPVMHAPAAGAAEPIETISSDAAPAAQPKPKKHGLGGLFGRKKKGEDSMSSWLGVDDDYDAKSSGRGIGSWDNFEDDDDGWKGGATSNEDVAPEEMIAAVASMSDDELLGHDIWFVATGASECDGAGMNAFLASHRDKLRGVFFINLESVGAGQISVVTAEGEQKVLKGDRRIGNLVSKVCAAFHVPCGNIELPYARTDSYVALEASRRALTIAGSEDGHIAYARTEDDLPYNVDPQNIALVSEVVTEVIRRS